MANLFRWTIHNVVAHPLHEALWLAAEACDIAARLLRRLSHAVHEHTIPRDVRPAAGERAE